MGSGHGEGSFPAICSKGQLLVPVVVLVPVDDSAQRIADARVSPLQFGIGVLLYDKYAQAHALDKGSEHVVNWAIQLW